MYESRECEEQVLIKSGLILKILSFLAIDYQVIWGKPAGQVHFANDRPIFSFEFQN